MFHISMLQRSEYETVGGILFISALVTAQSSNIGLQNGQTLKWHD